MAQVKRMKQGDRLPSFDVQFRFDDPDLDLSDEVTVSTPVVFTMTKVGATIPTIIQASATVVSSVDGIVTCRYEWDADDTATIGDYRAEFEATISGRKLTMPTQGYLHVRVEDDLA